MGSSVLLNKMFDLNTYISIGIRKLITLKWNDDKKQKVRAKVCKAYAEVFYLWVSTVY